MKIRSLLFAFLAISLSSLFPQGLIVHEHTGLKDTVVISTVDSVTFTQSMVMHKNTGSKDSVAFNNIDSVTFSAAINPAPAIKTISPTTASVGGPDFLLTVTGTNFLSSSEVKWNGTVLNTDYISATELQALVPAANIASQGTAAITVFTPAPGGGSSIAKSFVIGTITITKESFETGTKGGYAAADVKLATGTWNLNNALIGKDPNDVKNGVAAARIKLQGKLTMMFNLASGAGDVSILHAKYNNGFDGPTTWELWYSTNDGSTWNQAGSTVNTTHTTFDTARFTVNVSGLIRFEIRKTDTSSTYRIDMDDISISSYGSSSGNPVPVISSMNPTSDTVGAGPFTLTVNGSNFIPASVIVWGGTQLATTYISATQLQATIQPASLPAPGNVNVNVFTTNGGSSAPLVFTINPGVNSPVPTLRYFSPTTCTVGSAGFTLTVTGTNFVKKSVVNWNGVPLTTTFVSATQLQAALPAANVATIGTANVSVYTAPPSGGTSSAQTFSIVSGILPVTTNVNLTMGNPSNAVTDITTPLNYLIQRGQYATSYNRDRGIPNWTSWELDASWIGSASRGDFKTDSTLPKGWYMVNTGDYSGTGFSRGHMCPSADRTITEPDNDTLFLMTNMIPQTQAQNGGPWEVLEGYCRSLAQQGNKLYIVSGPYGEGGTGLNGYMTSIAGGKIAVPAKTWKVIMVLPAGTNDVSRVTDSTRCIAVIMNNDLGPFNSWGSYRVSVDEVEALTGFDFFSNVPQAIQAKIEAVVDNGPSN